MISIGLIQPPIRQETDREVNEPLAEIDLMSYLPDFYQQIVEMQAIQQELSGELGEQNVASEESYSQSFVSLATWGLSRWEKVIGLTSDLSLPDARRRENIVAKLRGAGTTNKVKIIQTATAFSGGEVNVIEFPAESRFEVIFVGVKGIPPNMTGITKMIEDIKPAHLAFTFKYTYTVWNQIGMLSWHQVRNKTWSELIVYKGE